MERPSTPICIWLSPMPAAAYTVHSIPPPDCAAAGVPGESMSSTSGNPDSSTKSSRLRQLHQYQYQYQKDDHGTIAPTADALSSPSRSASRRRPHSAFFIPAVSATASADGRGAKSYTPTLQNQLLLATSQLFATVISSVLLAAVLAWALVFEAWARLLRRFREGKCAVHAWEVPERHRNEQCVRDVRYYAQNARPRFDIVDEEVETEDGFLLRVHRIVNPRHRPKPDGKGGFPVLIMHGLFQSSGSFVTSEERSLAFWLSEHGGYQVFLGNSRSIFDMGHKTLSRRDPRFWDWTIRELALYDFPALVDFVCKTTGYEKIAYIGHSQGNGMAFLALNEGMLPEVGRKISCLIALAPAVYAGPLTHGFPFTTLRQLEWKRWKMIFGVLDFIPAMKWAYDFLPQAIFAHIGYVMFSYLFGWTDLNWLNRRKRKMFQFTPTPVSSASIFWWCGKGGFAQQKCTMDEAAPQWFNADFPPLAIYHGGRDYLVAAEPLLTRLKQEKHVKIIRVKKVDESEHCDFYLAASAVEWCFSLIMEDVEQTRPKDDDNIDAVDILA